MAWAWVAGSCALRGLAAPWQSGPSSALTSPCTVHAHPPLHQAPSMRRWRGAWFWGTFWFRGPGTGQILHL